MEIFNSFNNTFDNYTDDIILILMEEYNFKRLPNVIEFKPFCWGSMFDDDWKKDENDDLRFLREKIKKEFLNETNK